MTAPLAKPSSLANLGPAMDRYLAEIGIETADELRALGAVEAYARLRMMMPGGLSIMALYAMQAGLEGRAWTDLTPAERAGLRAAVAHPPVPQTASPARGKSRRA
jgi:DNA transformation protein